ncbi:MAG: DUF1538 domain-containing protein [Synergistaceae bacterium]|jgi:hypothetical protein|nr:DUF1538 domain-containing protein [Synergistaceae bacterium]
MGKILLGKLRESLQAVSPIVVIILLLHATIVPMPMGTLVLMVAGAVLLILGLTLFSLGTDLAMMPMGEHIGSALIQSRNLKLLIFSSFVFGFVVTIAEPDLQVMTKQVPSMPDWALLGGVAAGVAFFLVLGVLRILMRWRLSYMLMGFYALALLVALKSTDYVAVAFDASAVTTGPITVPFLLAMGVGIAATTGSRREEDDNFGICALCSIGPILTVLIMGLFYDAQSTGYEFETPAMVAGAAELARLFLRGFFRSFREVVMVVVPIFSIFMLYQVTHLRLSRTELVKIGVGLLYLMIGLTFFLTGVNSGFMPSGKYLGESMGALPYNWILVPICLVVGACVVVAEPAVHVLTKQVEEITSGAVSKRVMLFGMGLGVGLAMSLAMLRMLIGLSIWWCIVPGYLTALLLTFYVPDIFVGIGFDSGGVAAGAMSAAFVLPFTIGVCNARGGNIMSEAFGVIGMIAMMPPITVQAIGLIYDRLLKKAQPAAPDEGRGVVE